jgi:phytoene/squalene synthetase
MIELSDMPPQSTPSLAEANRYCQFVTQKRAGNFSYAFRFLPGRTRQNLCNAYAWCRHIDDIADDESLSLEARADQLSIEHDRLLRISNGSSVEAVYGAELYVALEDLLASSNVQLEIDPEPSTVS